MSDSNNSLTVGSGIKVTGDAGIDLTKATSAKQFTDWLASIDSKRFTVRSVHIQSLDMFGPVKVGFIKFKADIVDTAGKPVSGIVFARGGSVGILPVLKCGDKTYTVLTVQPRAATGNFEFVELPAGMLDGSGNFAGVAAKELDEELGIKIAEGDLTDLSATAGHSKGFYPSPGGCDETIRLFYFTREVSAEELADMNGRLTGCLTENEQITLKISPLDDSLLSIPDSKTIVAYALYQQVLRKAAAAQPVV